MKLLNELKVGFAYYLVEGRMKTPKNLQYLPTKNQNQMMNNQNRMTPELILLGNFKMRNKNQKKEVNWRNEPP